MTRCTSLLLIAPLAAGCMSPKIAPRVDLGRSLLPSLAAMPEDEAQRLMGQRVVLRPPLRAVVVGLDGPTSSSLLPDAERLSLLRSFAAELERGPFSSVTILPTQPLNPAAGGNLDSGDLSRLRGAAARFQADVLVLLDTESDQYVDWNPLGVSYVALVPWLFVPGDQLAVYTSAEACAIDVRTGVFLGCAQGSGKSERALSWAWQRERVLRSLAVKAASQSVRDLPSPLRGEVGSRIARPSGLAPEPIPGLSYETE